MTEVEVVAAQQQQKLVPSEAAVTETTESNGAQNPESHPQNGESQVVEGAAAENGEEEEMVPIVNFEVRLANGKLRKFEFPVTETVSEIHVYLQDNSETKHDTCFHLEFESVSLSPLTPLCEIPNFQNGSVIKMIEDPYNQREVLIQVNKVRQILFSLHMHDYPPSVFPYVTPKESDPMVDFSKVGKTLKETTIDMEQFYSGSLNPEEVPVRCLHSIKFSDYNPPTPHRNLQGDIAYLEIEITPKNILYVTASIGGFYVNGTGKQGFNPNPQRMSHLSHTLIDMLCKADKTFATSWVEFCNYLINHYPIESIFDPLAPPFWCVPLVERRRNMYDPTTALQPPLDTLDGLGQLREWNNDYQSCRDLPRNTFNERFLRDRALNKIHGEFLETAIRSATLIVNGAISPLYPTDDPKHHIFLYNNIFFSFGFDARDCFAQLGGDAAAHAASNKDLAVLRLFSQLDIPEPYTLLTALIDYKGYRIIAQAIFPGLLNNEQVIAYGSVDSGETIFCKPDFHEVVENVANILHLRKHTVIDGKGESVELWGSVDCKGVVGNDSRKYLLDLYRLTPTDPNFLKEETSETEKDFPSYPHSLPLFRTELIQGFYEAQLINYIIMKRSEMPKDQDKEAAIEDLQNQAKGFDLRFNVDIDNIVKLGDEEEALETDRKNRDNLGAYIIGVVIPTLINDIIAFDVIPNDSTSLTTIMHARGINMRYLGKITTLCETQENRLTHIVNLCKTEMIVRAFKHIARPYLRDIPNVGLAVAISHLFNCLFGSKKSIATKAEISSLAQRVKNNNLTNLLNMTPESLWKQIQEEVKARFRYDLKLGSKLHFPGYLRPVAVLRPICKKLGIQILQRKYSFSPDRVIFKPTDIVGLFPVVKTAAPKSLDALSMTDTGRANLPQGGDHTTVAVEFCMEACSVLQQINPLHPDLVTSLSYLALGHFQMGEIANAISAQKRAVIISERVFGLDDPQTMKTYISLAYFCQSNGDLKTALAYMHRVKFLSNIIYADENLELAATEFHVATMMQAGSNFKNSIEFCERAGRLNERFLGNKSIQTATSYHLLGKAYASKNDYKNGADTEKLAYSIFKEKLGMDDPLTKESATLLRFLLEQIVNNERSKDLMTILQDNSTKQAIFSTMQVPQPAGSGSKSNPAPANTTGAVPARPKKTKLKQMK